MIDLTVKTLDSQNHAFSLADDITIRAFKEHIAETVSVPADSQRLIYCGRVLQDEKHLSEYDVNGKVIHLVQRAPPQSTQRGNSGGGGQSHGQNRGRGGDQSQTRGGRYRQARTQFHGNPMYLGSISIPAEVVEGHEWPIPQLSSTLSNSRLVVARRMLDQANRVLDRLENPTAAASASASANDSGNPENDESSTGNGTTANTEDSEELSGLDDQLFQRFGPPGPLYQIAAAIAGRTRSPYVFQSRTGGAETPGAEPSAPDAETTDESDTPTQEQQQQQSSRQESANASTDQSGNARASPSAAPQPPRPPQMAQLLGRLMETQDRLRPFLTRYRELMELDPEIPGGRTANGEDIGTVEDNQRIADGVTECLHFLSHANHALSDIIVDVGQQPPRNLRCRPIFIQHSAILQAGIPIQVEAHISVARNDGSNGESGEESGDAATRPPTTATVTPPSAQNPIDLSFLDEQHEQTPPIAQQAPEQQAQQAQSQPQIDSPFGAIFNLTNNMEVLMEMGPHESGGITVSGLGSATGNEQTPTNGGNNNNNVNNNNNNAPGTSGVAGIFPWGPSPPPEVFRNLLTVVAGYMAQRATTVPPTATTTTTSNPTACLRQRAMGAAVGGGAPPNPGQSTQARSNVGTHPTTSTQTRSTARPHVFHPHAHPLGVGVGMGQNMDFDPFLPCNSHHISRTPSATPNNTAATSSPQQTSQPSQNTTPNGNAQTQQEGPTAAAEETAVGPAINQATSDLRLQDEIAKFRQSNGAESENAVTLEELLLARGINITRQERSPGSGLLQRLFAACAKIELREWCALLNNGKFSRDDTWRRLRPHLTGLIAFDRVNSERRFVTEIITEIQPYLDGILDSNEQQINVGNFWIDVSRKVDYILLFYIKELAFYVKKNVCAPNDEEWGRNLMKILRSFGREICVTLRTDLRRKQAGLEDLIRLFAARAMSSQHGELREWVVGSVVDWFCEYSRLCPDGSEESIRASFRNSEETSDSDETANLPRSQEATSQSVPEPMETEEASVNGTINDPLELDDGQEVPTTFPGHESLLPEWVPIIARDGIRQRRQLQLQGAGVTAFSDAYLDGLPSKRRKLVDQQKPRLLVSPTANRASIPASMERLVRDSVARAGVEEADGAAAAVAADPGVRRAFGQAIRECLNPRRLQTPDFPDPRRFPNATSYFTDKDRPTKQ